MTDGTSLLIRHPEDIERIRSNKNLDFKPKYGYLSAKYKGLEIKLRANSCWINGSLHKFKNNGEHNADDFTYSDLEKVLIDLCNEIGINPESAEIKNIEIGVNIKLPYNPSLFINSVIKRKTYYPIVTTIGIEFRYSQYTIKIYSKSRQEKKYEKDNILRVEVRFNKMIQAREKVGQIQYLNDLLKPFFWFHSGGCLNSLLDDIDIINMEEVINEKIPFLDMVEILKWQYRSRWEPCAIKRQRMRKKIYKICEAHSLIDIKKNVQREIKRKVDEFLDYPKVKDYKLQAEATREKMLQIYI